MVKRMTVAKALDYFHKSVFSNEVLEKYVCCKESTVYKGLHRVGI